MQHYWKKYIGSTCKTISQRLKQHEYDYKRYLNDKFNYIKSFDILQLDDYTISLLEKVNCDTQEELNAFEGHYIKKFKDFAVNKMVMGRTRKQHYQDNKEEIQEYQKQYKLDNKVILNEKQREKILCDCGIQYTKANKARHMKTTHHKEYMADQDDD